jgi:hypothetical protein
VDPRADDSGQVENDHDDNDGTDAEGGDERAAILHLSPVT